MARQDLHTRPDYEQHDDHAGEVLKFQPPEEAALRDSDRWLGPLGHGAIAV